jgi:hypothetical protein
MSTIIREAIIQIETRMKRSRLEAPAVDGLKSHAEFASKAEQATNKAEQAHRRFVETTRNSSFMLASHFREGGEGALRMARRLALLSASGDEELKKLVHSVALAQGAFDVFAGSFKAIQHLSRAVGPVGAAVAGVTTVLGLGAAAWSRWGGAAEAAADTAEKRLSRMKAALQDAEAEQRSRAELGDLKIRHSPEDEKLKVVRAELAREREQATGLAAREKTLRDAEQAQRLFGTPGGNLGRVFQPFGPLPENSVEQRASIAERLGSSTRRQIELAEQEKNLSELAIRQQEKLIREITNAGVRGLNNVGLPNVGSTIQNSQFIQNFGGAEAAVQQLNTQFKSLINGLIDTVGEAAHRHRQLRSELDSGGSR